MKKTKLERAEELATQIEQMNNRRKLLLQEYKEELRRARTHRICKRGAMIESILPETVNLNDEQIKLLLETMLTSRFVRNRLDEIQNVKISESKTEPVKTTPVITGNANASDKSPGVNESDI